MSRRSASPRRHFDSKEQSRPSSHRSGQYRNRDNEGRRDRGYDDRPRWSSTRDKDREYTRPRDGDDHYGGNHRDYNEGDRERERERDRERYDKRDRERELGASHRTRRSASPRPRDSQPRGPSRSTSPQPASKNSKPNFKPSGLLAAETNTVKASDGTSTVLKYNEPPEARKPVAGWRLYVFKGKEQLELLHIYRQSAYLVGRDRLVADISVDHPSCSKQHAAIQYRYIQETDEYGSSKGSVKPFIIDLESTNGTLVNDETIPAARYYELKTSDVIKFGLSDREYVILNDETS
ncbi:SMAD/FHA domain-containing protein [Crepidotus variabilis]|uniref:SMAD/FHA domain-containing protein n=1 Tax=Crepidotus variabilis TaxID=179855 RepID=A0A9P6ER00_9AGAR|nr:SMAD/FHA domain-containing protein [Crepidotus variabilis]